MIQLDIRPRRGWMVQRMEVGGGGFDVGDGGLEVGGGGLEVRGWS